MDNELNGGGTSSEEELPDIGEITRYVGVRKIDLMPPRELVNFPHPSLLSHNGDAFHHPENSRNGLDVKPLTASKEVPNHFLHDSPAHSSKFAAVKNGPSTSAAIVKTDSDGFLPPPPASTLLKIRRTRTSSTGGSTYVVSNPTSHVGNGSSVKRRLSGGDKNSFSKSERRASSEVGKGKHKSYREMNGSAESHKMTSLSKNIAKFKKGIKGREHQSRKDMLKRVGKIKEKFKVKNPVNIDPVTGKRRYKKRGSFPLHSKHLHKHVSRRDAFEPEPEPDDDDYEDAVEDEPVTSLTWRPNDDLRLIVNVIQTNDLKQVHLGVKFSCRFTLEDIRTRWKNLLYNEKVAKVALTACRNIHSKVRRKILTDSLLSEAEIKKLQSVKSTTNPTLETFERLLKKDQYVFRWYRTPKFLYKYWTELKELNMLDDQDVRKTFEKGSENFADFESSVDDDDVRNLQVDPEILQEILREDRRNKKKIRILEEEIANWQDLAELVWEGQIAKAPQFDENTFALLRGKNVRFAMAAKEITLGRRTDTNWVDADLSEEGNDCRVSRRQATIKMRALGDFVILNQGKHPMYIDGQALLPGEVASLQDHSVIKVSELNFVFIVNDKLLTEHRKKILEEESNADHVNVQNPQQSNKTKEPVSNKKNSSKDSHPKPSTEKPGSSNPNPRSSGSANSKKSKAKDKDKDLQSGSSSASGQINYFPSEALPPKKPPVKRPKKPKPKVVLDYLAPIIPSVISAPYAPPQPQLPTVPILLSTPQYPSSAR